MVKLRSVAVLAKESGLLLVGRYSQYVVTLVTIPLTARSLGATGLGILAIGQSAYFLGSSVTDWGLSQTLAARNPSLAEMKASQRQFRRFRLLVLAFVVGAASCIALLPWTVSAAVAIGVVVGAVSSLGDEWVLLGLRSFGQLAVCQIVGRLTFLMLLLVVVAAGASPVLVLLTMGGGAAVSVGCSVFLANRAIRGGQGLSDQAGGCPAIAPRLRHLARLGLPVMTSRLLSNTYSVGLPVVLAAFLPLPVVGIFSASDKVIRALSGLWDAVGNALLPRGRLALLQESAVRQRWLRRLEVWTLCFALVLAGGLAICADLVVRVLYGSPFAESASVLTVQSAAAFFMILNAIAINAVIYPSGRTNKILLSTCAGLVGAAIGVPILVMAPSAMTGGVVTILSEGLGSLFAVVAAHRIARAGI